MSFDLIIRKIVECEIATIYKVKTMKSKSGWSLIWDANKEMNTVVDTYYKSMTLDQGFIYISSYTKWISKISFEKFKSYVDEVMGVYYLLAVHLNIVSEWECIALVLEIVEYLHDGFYMIHDAIHETWLSQCFVKISEMLYMHRGLNQRNGAKCDLLPSSTSGTCTHQQRVEVRRTEEEGGARELGTPPTLLAPLS